MIICLSFLTFGIFLSLANNIQSTAKSISRDQTIVFFLNKDISEQTIKIIGENIAQSQLFIKSEFISPDMALKRFKRKFPDLQDILVDLNTNPFPASYEAVLNEKNLDSSQTQNFLESMKHRKGVEDIRFNKDWIKRLESFSRLARAIGFFLGGILILASFFIISNVIKLNVLARKDEIEIQRLVGATNAFIRIPFFLEGIFLGAFGGALSLLLLLAVVKFFPLYLGSSLGVLSELINFRFLSTAQSLMIVISGAVVGLLGSSSSLSKFMKT